jgi:DNA-binding NarL/FixJ family response regulator
VDEQLIRVFCVDDSAATLRLNQLLIDAQADMQCVGIALTTAHVVEEVERTSPHVVLLDYLMPGCSPLSTAKDLRARFPELRVLIVSGLEDDAAIDEALAHGASGYFVKTQAADEFMSAIRRVARGERVLATRRAAVRWQNPARE